MSTQTFLQPHMARRQGHLQQRLRRVLGRADTLQSASGGAGRGRRNLLGLRPAGEEGDDVELRWVVGLRRRQS